MRAAPRIGCVASVAKGFGFKSIQQSRNAGPVQTDGPEQRADLK